MSIATTINLPQLFFGDQPEALADFGLHIVAKFPHQVHLNFSGCACKPCGRVCKLQTLWSRGPTVFLHHWFKQKLFLHN